MFWFMCAIVVLVVAVGLTISTMKNSHKFDVEALIDAHKQAVTSLKDESNEVLSKLKDEVSYNDKLEKQLEEERNNSASQLSKRKSPETRLGLVAENFMPLLEDYPYDHKNFRFLGNPVDGIQFEDGAVVFMEFKSGNARLSKVQKKIRDAVTSGNIRFETFRVNDKGTDLHSVAPEKGEIDESIGESLIL